MLVYFCRYNAKICSIPFVFLKNILAKIMSLITKLCVYYMKVCLKNKINYDII